jgi:hypothetical protein
MMECWKIGIMGLKGLNLFFETAGKTGIKIRINSVFNPQYSIIPPFHYSIGRLKENFTPAG